MTLRPCALLVVVLAACASNRPAVEPSERSEKPNGPEEVQAPAVDGSASTAARSDIAEFSLGCETKQDGPARPRVEIVRTPQNARWLWACRALAVLGPPKTRDSGYPDFQVKDGPTGACMTLSFEDVGAFVYHAPPGRAEALREFLEAGPKPIPDCSFEIGVNGSLPMKVGVRSGEPYEERLDTDSFQAARSFFEAHPSEYSAGNFLTRYLELEPRERPADVSALLEQAVDIELDVFDKMESAWLSPIGKKGYCDRTKELGKVPVSAPGKQRIAVERKRFCKR